MLRTKKYLLGTAAHTLFALATWRPGFMRPWVSNKTLTRGSLCQSCWSVSTWLCLPRCCQVSASETVTRWWLLLTQLWRERVCCATHFDAHRDALILILSVCRIFVLFLCTNLGLARVCTLIAGITFGFCFKSRLTPRCEGMLGEWRYNSVHS